MAELVVLFVVLPLCFRFRLVPIPPIPALWLLTAYCLFRLFNDRGFDRSSLWKPEALRAAAPQILGIFVVCALLISGCVYFLAPKLLFNFVRRAPAFWALVMILYPILSVYPQGIVYRAFFYQRYRPLFQSQLLLITMSAVAFSFAHVIFRNPIALLFTLVGGFLFAARYAWTASLFTSAFEHALYGCFMFTIGLGEFFYKGARAAS